MATTKRTEQEEEKRLYRPRRSRKIVFREFTAIPTAAARRCLDLSDAALRIWLALALASEGHSQTVTASNVELMAAAGVSKSRFYPARTELQKAGILAFTTADARRERWTYDLQPANPQAAKARNNRRGNHPKPMRFKPRPGTSDDRQREVEGILEGIASADRKDD